MKSAAHRVTLQARVLGMLQAVAPDGLTCNQMREALAVHDDEGEVVRRDCRPSVLGALRLLELKGHARGTYEGRPLVWYAA